MTEENAKNVMGTALQACCMNPKTGYFRDGYCNTDRSDRGNHTVCAEMTEAFLAFSRSRGNDLITPMTRYGFPGLKPGQCWCLCASRWLEAYEANVAPPIKLSSTHENALKIVPLSALKSAAIDLM